MEKKERLKSILVLTAICLVVSALLAVTNELTGPVIEANNAAAEQQSLKLVLPEATEFEKLDLSDLPATVTSAYKDRGGAGYVFVLTIAGYSASTPMRVSVSVSPAGEIIRCYVIGCDGETDGYGKKVSEDWFTEQYVGATAATVGDTALISGATITSFAFRSGIADAMAVYESIAKEVPAA